MWTARPARAAWNAKLRPDTPPPRMTTSWVGTAPWYTRRGAASRHGLERSSIGAVLRQVDAAGAVRGVAAVPVAAALARRDHRGHLVDRRAGARDQRDREGD